MPLASKSKLITVLTRVAVAGCVVFVLGCPEMFPPTEDPNKVAAEQNFPTSFHGDRHGKDSFYAAPDGFYQLTNIPFTDLPCVNCHAATLADGTAVDAATYTPSCADCHADPENPAADVTDNICLGCHSRQGAEQNAFTDVHRASGMGCMDCHSGREMHGDGTVYASFLSEGAMDADCENCHTEGGTAPVPPASITEHALHSSKLHCSACHVASVSSCYNCHFESEVAHTGKRFFNQAPRSGFKLLVNFNGKVHTATFQSLVYEDQTFVVIAPFFGHSITKDNASRCPDCHWQSGAGNAKVGEYADTGTIVVTDWDPNATGADRLVGPTGIIPVPPDWATSLEFAYLTYGGEATDAINGPNNLPLWDFLTTEPDGTSMPYGTPLTTSQMNALTNN